MLRILVAIELRIFDFWSSVWIYIMKKISFIVVHILWKWWVDSQNQATTKGSTLQNRSINFSMSVNFELERSKFVCVQLSSHWFTSAKQKILKQSEKIENRYWRSMRCGIVLRNNIIAQHDRLHVTCTKWSHISPLDSLKVKGKNFFKIFSNFLQIMFLADIWSCIK